MSIVYKNPEPPNITNLHGAFALHQFALFLSYSFLVSIVNPFIQSGNKGGTMLCLRLSVPGEGSQCSASALALLAGFLNSVHWLPTTYPIVQLGVGLLLSLA